VIMTSLQTFGNIRTLGAIAQEAAQSDYSVTLLPISDPTLGRRADVTAIFAANDQMALGVMRALHEIGRDIPGDISIVGFDDMAEARSFWPPLTTVRQDFAASAG
jgi:ABC-type sugar transport system substrate-binding protein